MALYKMLSKDLATNIHVRCGHNEAWEDRGQESGAKITMVFFFCILTPVF